MSEFVELLGNGFFPIIVCGILFWYVYTTQTKTNELIKDLKNSIEKLNETIINHLIPNDDGK